MALETSCDETAGNSIINSLRSKPPMRNMRRVYVIIDISNYRWRSPAFNAWMREHGVDMKEVLRIDVNEYTQIMTVHEFVRSADGFPLTNYKTMQAAETTREIKLMSPMPN